MMNEQVECKEAEGVYDVTLQSDARTCENLLEKSITKI